MNISAVGDSRLLLYITRSLNQYEQKKIGPGNVLLSRTRGLKPNEAQIMVSSRQFCGSCLEPMQPKNHSGTTRSKGHKFLGSYQAGLFAQQQRFYSGEGRRWIMKQHFKGMPNPEVDLAIIIITNTIVISTSRGCPPLRWISQSSSSPSPL